jgi:hypothetical protein
MWVAAGMLSASLATVLLIAPRIERIRASVAGPVASLPASEPRRLTFGRLHALSTGLLALTLVAGVGLIWTEMDDRH